MNKPSKNDKIFRHMRSSTIFLSLAVIFLLGSFLIISRSEAATQIKLQVNNCIATSTCTSTSTIITSGSGGGSHRTYTILYPLIIPTSHDVIISWTTDREARSTLFWGTTLDYELGSIGEVNLSTDHVIQIQGLDPATRYYFKIESLDIQNKKYIGNGEFFTLPLSDITPPSNVTDIKTDLKNVGGDNFISITWTNPPEIDFDHIRVVRSSSFYPQDETDGKIVYEGPLNYFDDHGLAINADYFYSFFSYDASGNISSGSILHVRLSSASDQSIPVISRSQDYEFYLSLKNFDFIQRERKIFFSTDTIDVNSKEGIDMSILKERLIPGTQYILISVEDPLRNGNFNSYLMRSMYDQTHIEVTIPSLQKPGSYSFFVTFLDGNKNVISQTHGTFNAESGARGWWSRFIAYIHMWISRIRPWIKALLTHKF